MNKLLYSLCALMLAGAFSTAAFAHSTKKDACIAWVNTNSANLAKNYLAYRTSAAKMGNLILGQQVVHIAKSNCRISGEFNKPVIVEKNGLVTISPISSGKNPTNIGGCPPGVEMCAQ
ncbi:MAG: hypothetical protein V4525_08660 [Pseudomonadota bacterium]